MKLIFRTLLVTLAALTVASIAFGQTDIAGSKDYPEITRMPNTFITNYKNTTFDSFTFYVTQNKKETKQSVEGKTFFIHYRLIEGTQFTSPLQKIRNYQNAARAAGGQVVYEYLGSDTDITTFVLHKGTSEIWVQLTAYTNAYDLNIVEKQVMQQEVTIDAAAMASSIADTGSVAIYGINFDTGSFVIKPESEPAIDEIATLLTNNPALKVGIVGHTDMVGDAASNLKLSQARAQSVINELVTKHHIAATRLGAFGAGPWAPLASNKTDDGRAKNRRVELVEIATK